MGVGVSGVSLVRVDEVLSARADDLAVGRRPNNKRRGDRTTRSNPGAGGACTYSASVCVPPRSRYASGRVLAKCCPGGRRVAESESALRLGAGTVGQVDQRHQGVRAVGLEEGEEGESDAERTPPVVDQLAVALDKLSSLCDSLEIVLESSLQPQLVAFRLIK